MSLRLTTPQASKFSLRVFLALLPILFFSFTQAEGQTKKLIKNSSQSNKDFLISNAPEGFSEYIHGTEKSSLKIKGHDVLIAVYGVEANSQKKSDDDLYEQKVLAFIKEESSKFNEKLNEKPKNKSPDKVLIESQPPETYLKYEIDMFVADGGVPRKILAIFQDRLIPSNEDYFSILTTWDAAAAGGHSVMEKVGLFYEINLYKLDDQAKAERYTGSLGNPISSCDCKIFDKEGRLTGQEKSQFKNAAEAKKYLRSIFKK